jgi:hypothetical protein
MSVLSTLELIEDGVRIPGLARNRRQGSRAERKSLRKIFGLKQKFGIENMKLISVLFLENS